jgi:nitrogen regulatory protein P-II
MKNMKKVEFVIEAVYVKRLIDLFKQHDIHGYTIIKDIEGAGGHGVRTADDVSDMFTNNYIFTVCEAKQFENMEIDVRKFLEKYGGKCMLSDVKLLLGEKQRKEAINLKYSGNIS